MPEPIKPGAISEADLRKYLLGDASIQDQEKVDTWLMSDDEAYDLLEAAEDDLIDAALAGRLDKRDLQLFNNHFLAAPERQRKYQFSRSFLRAIDSVSQPATNRAPAPQPAMRWSLLDVFRYSPAFAYTATALVAIMSAVSLWSVFRVDELQRKLQSTTERAAVVERAWVELQRAADRDAAAIKSRETVNSPSDGPVLLAVNLMPGLTRSSADIPSVKLTPTTSSVRFSLVLLDDNFTTFRVSLRNPDDREILFRDKIRTTSSRDGKLVVVTLPSNVLPDGDYSINLLGIPESGTPETVARYYFRAAR